ncbi:MAG: phospholipase [Kofleriaceae bacterium]
MTITRIDLAGLTTRIIGPSDATTTVVLLHGFGAPGDDLVALAEVLAVPSVRFVFPAAPLELGGLYGDSRAWWLLDLAKLEQELRAGTPRDRRAEIPEGLPAARDHVGRLLDQLQARYNVTPDRLVLGGFSQGAMVALDAALFRPQPPSALVLMSGTLVAETDWMPRMPAVKGMPVLMSHGRADGLLPFSVAETLRDRLKEAGAAVDWHPFVGGHEIPMTVLRAVKDFLASRATAAG